MSPLVQLNSIFALTAFLVLHFFNLDAPNDFVSNSLSWPFRLKEKKGSGKQSESDSEGDREEKEKVGEKEIGSGALPLHKRRALLNTEEAREFLFLSFCALCEILARWCV